MLHIRASRGECDDAIVFLLHIGSSGSREDRSEFLFALIFTPSLRSFFFRALARAPISGYARRNRSDRAALRCCSTGWLCCPPLRIERRLKAPRRATSPNVQRQPASPIRMLRRRCVTLRYLEHSRHTEPCATAPHRANAAIRYRILSARS